ncbi:MAG TPA: fluoride efflux transporter CrcB [Pyrinomonadaceae bacterium]|nr:fluoride efflux transporter CrcB [Pyrinomonadaceae bacterium]
MDTLTKYLAVAAGSAAGGMLRYFLGGTILSRTAAPFPAATFVINVTGSFVVGFFLTLATERLPMSAHLRLAVAVGFVGAYTTFSTFEYETLRLAEEHGLHFALLNVVLSVVVGFAAVWGGARLARIVAAHAPASGHAGQGVFQQQANSRRPAREEGAPQRDIRDSTIEPPFDV